LSAQLKLPPVVIARMLLDSPATATGIGLSVVVPSPSWPNSL